MRPIPNAVNHLGLLVVLAGLPAAHAAERLAEMLPQYGHHYLSQRPSFGDVAATDALRFSTTQSWLPELFGAVERFDGWISEADFALLALPPAAANSSALTGAELRYLHELIERRTPALIGRIRQEIALDGFWVPAFIAERGGVQRFPATERLVLTTMAQVEPVVMTMKRRYDRVRPDRLDPAIAPVIDVPQHPAYPSGHATQSHMLAFIFAELDPERTAEYLDRAREISVHREIAGVHYPSDTFAGTLLARQVVDLLWGKPQFQALVAAARREWNAAR